MEKVFSNKKALVIGGTGGIGKAVALALAERGAELIIHGGSSQERLESTLKAIKGLGADVRGFLCPADASGAAERVLAGFPDPDILICAWGPFRQGSLETLNSDFWQEMVAGNLIFPGTLVSLILPGMLKKNWGRILLFGGTNTDIIRGFTTTTAYAAAKTALGVVAKSAARMGANCGLTCNVICPGLTDTEYLDENGLRYNREHSPGGLSLEPGEIARVCMAILENPGINGAIIPMDKGIIL